ncbi:hypothetical protein [Streptomyces zagrosensis]|uniref:Uncharacterized protein n=1 Tax=Streptomyces zagrosensis TaxID=1042984 RepID=A0A7W9QBN6_9ACTN|nr:hypothetical protein [Streptomyces zagrosensis]MBB5937286.1 hypothetical protein [Streptomyces zagrosensis]
MSPETTLTEIDKLFTVRATGLPRDLFADVAPKVVACWRARAEQAAAAGLASARGLC